MYSFSSRVRVSESDSDLNLSLPGFFNYFQDCGTFHSEDIGNGMALLKESDLAWILSSWQIVIDRYPKMAEHITVNTWAYGWKGCLGFRNYTMKDASGKRIAWANTNWIYLNIRTLRPVHIPKEVSDMYSCDPPLDEDFAPRRISLPADMVRKDPVKFRRLDMDSNGHINNERYVPMAMEYLPDGFITRQVRVEYRKSAKYDDTIYPFIGESDGLITISLSDERRSPYAIMEFIPKHR